MKEYIRTITGFVIVFFLFSCSSGLKENNTDIPLPDKAQIRYQNYERTMFVCIDPATWQGREYDNHTSDLAEMKLSALDTDQWCEVAQSWGARLILFVAKHTGGFCWWNTETSEYSVKNIPWKDGKGDVLGELSESCKKYGLDLGIYVYPGDDTWGAGIGSGGRTSDPQKQEEYNRVFRRQMTEVLTKYGPVREVWFDGSCIIDVSDILSEHAADAVIFQGPQATIRWVGNENGIGPYPNWYTLKSADAKSGTATAVHSDPEGDVYAPVEINLPLLNNNGHKWFWAPDTDHLLLNVDQLMDVYYRSAGRGGVMLLNSTPDTSGLIPKSHVAIYKEFGSEIKRRFSTPLASVSGSGKLVKMNFDKEIKIDHVIIREDIAYGQRVREYTLEANLNGSWEEIYRGSSIGSMKIDRFDPVTTSKIRIKFDEYADVPQIEKFEAFYVGTDDSERGASQLSKPVNVGSWNGKTFSEDWQAWSVDLTGHIDMIGQYSLNFQVVSQDYGKQCGLEFRNWTVEMYGEDMPGAIERKGDSWSFIITRSQQTQDMDEFPTIVRMEIRTKPGESTGNIDLNKIEY